MKYHAHRLVRSKGLVLDLQAGVLDTLPTRIVAPLHPVADMGWTFNRLTPLCKIDGRSYVLSVQRLAAVEVRAIGPSVADLSALRDQITAALDLLFQGF
ncbi:CcdB family protein [Rhizobium sp. CC-YZS058]|uniref:CcdB family protein n=1 Tax=Rhizobium sp. CC-YZS058 TaxID=3042153 RepID=UPI002B05E048|nr:CcdB family protein [Rhizobium sp. CC-YZS058]MEA3533407.1 CcdB family protein [Rhizobium sp. CC-YZS058]